LAVEQFDDNITFIVGDCDCKYANVNAAYDIL
jgi:hypothetical protein